MSIPLPAITTFALDNTWIYGAVPCLWIGILLLLLWRFRGRAVPVELVQTHTSLTLLIGISMLAVFLMAGILPFVTLIVGF